MPKRLEARLLREANAAGLSGKRKDAFVYGTMRNAGWRPEAEKKHRARAMAGALRRR